MKARIALIAIPALIGVVIALAHLAGVLPGGVRIVWAETWLIALLIGLLVSGALWFLVVNTKRRLDAQRTSLEKENAEDRRRFMRRLDHELKNPLMAIRAGIANANSTLPNANVSALTSADAQAQRMGRLVGDLRKLADLEQQPLAMADVNIADVLTEAVSLAKDHPRADARRITLTLPQAPRPVPSVKGDYDLLVLAVYNLIENALKYSDANATVEVRALDDGRSVTVEVADTGKGIPADELPHVWEELYRGEGAREIGGSGLGLSLVRAIVLRHNGRADVRSWVGQGTVFSLVLPI